MASNYIHVYPGEPVVNKLLLHRVPVSASTGLVFASTVTFIENSITSLGTSVSFFHEASEPFSLEEKRH